MRRAFRTRLQTLALGSGSCRDFAMLMIEAVRSLGIAARFVSGYLHIPDDGGDGHAGAGSTHAWAQVYLPGPGWVDFDPSSGIIGNRDLVRVAVVHDPRQAVPLHGTWMGFPSDYLRNGRRSRRHLRRRRIERRKRRFRGTYEVRYMMPIEIRTNAPAFRSLAINLEGDWVRLLTSRGDLRWKSEWATS